MLSSFPKVFFAIGAVCLLNPVELVCDPTDCRWPGSSVYGISQAGRPEWVPFFLQIQRSNPCLLHWQTDSRPLNHLGNLGVERVESGRQAGRRGLSLPSASQSRSRPKQELSTLALKPSLSGSNLGSTTMFKIDG